MLKQLFILLAFFCASLSAYGDDSLLFQAQQQYQDGQFAEAAQLYIKALESEPANASLYHNLGLALDRNQNLGAAVAAYLRSVQLRPHDPDFQYNLRFLLDKTEDHMSADLPGHSILPGFLSARALFYLMVFFLVSGLGLLIWNNLRALRGLPILISSILCIVLSLGALAVTVRKAFYERDPGAVSVPKAKVYAGPSGALMIFELHEGAPLQVLQESGDWVQIELADQKSGWIKKDQLVCFGKVHRYLPQFTRDTSRPNEKS